jgi:hypothetical protein
VGKSLRMVLTVKGERSGRVSSEDAIKKGVCYFGWRKKTCAGSSHRDQTTRFNKSKMSIN